MTRLTRSMLVVRRLMCLLLQTILIRILFILHSVVVYCITVHSMRLAVGWVNPPWSSRHSARRARMSHFSYISFKHQSHGSRDSEAAQRQPVHRKARIAPAHERSSNPPFMVVLRCLAGREGASGEPTLGSFARHGRLSFASQRSRPYFGPCERQR